MVAYAVFAAILILIVLVIVIAVLVSTVYRWLRGPAAPRDRP
jgi:hypothetical protein